jgi:hypothetical protein
MFEFLTREGNEMGFFQWITEGVRRAIVEGVEQAAADINAGEGESEITLRLPHYREASQLPHDEPPTTNGRRKAVAR